MRRWPIVVLIAASAITVAKGAALSFGETVVAGLVVVAVSAVAGWFLGVPGRISRWRIARREYLPPEVTPDYLCGLRKGLTQIAGDDVVRRYRGKWLQPLTRNLSNLEPAELGQYRALFHDSSATFPQPRKASVFMYFGWRWGGRLKVAPVGSAITATGKVGAVGDNWINLHNCELVEGNG